MLGKSTGSLPVFLALMYYCISMSFPFNMHESLENKSTLARSVKHWPFGFWIGLSVHPLDCLMAMASVYIVHIRHVDQCGHAKACGACAADFAPLVPNLFHF